jgi:hypothetical protein
VSTCVPWFSAKVSDVRELLWQQFPSSAHAKLDGTAYCTVIEKGSIGFNVSVLDPPVAVAMVGLSLVTGPLAATSK